MIDELRKTLTPPFETKHLYTIFISLFLVISIPLTVIEVKKDEQVSVKASANNEVKSHSSVDIASVLGKKVSGQVNVSLKTSNKTEPIKELRLKVNGRLIGSIYNENSGDFSGEIVWNTLKEQNGIKTILAESVTESNEVDYSETKQVEVQNIDQISPTISFENLIDGSLLSGNKQLVKLSVIDNNAVAKVEITVDGNKLAVLDATPFNFDWDLSNVSVGNHTIVATAYDFGGNNGENSIQVYRATSLSNY